MITSSSPKDVLRHFLQVRLHQIETKAEAATQPSITQALDTYRQTLLDSRALFPKLFAESLSQVGKLPIVQDAQVISRHELNLDVFGIWLSLIHI